MNFVLLTWNPGPDDSHAWDQSAWDREMVGETLGTAAKQTTWSVGRHVNNINEGDTAFMYRQGEAGRGLVARGSILGCPWRAPHWKDAARTTNYVDVLWQECIPVDLAVDVTELESLAPEFAWRRVYASGRQLPLKTGETILSAWNRYVGSAMVQSSARLYGSDLWRAYLEAEEVSFA